MGKKIFLFTCLFLFTGFAMLHAQAPSLPLQSKKEGEQIRLENSKKAAAMQFQYFVIKAPEETYGYSIYVNGNLYIHQLTIPAIQGNKGFRDTLSAAKTARLVIEKIKKGEMPPSVSIEEMKKINVRL